MIRYKIVTRHYKTQQATIATIQQKIKYLQKLPANPVGEAGGDKHTVVCTKTCRYKHIKD